MSKQILPFVAVFFVAITLFEAFIHGHTGWAIISGLAVICVLFVWRRLEDNP